MHPTPQCAASLHTLPFELVVSILLHLGPSPSSLRWCFLVSSRFNAATWAAVAHGGVVFESMLQRKRFCEALAAIVPSRSSSQVRRHSPSQLPSNSPSRMPGQSPSRSPSQVPRLPPSLSPSDSAVHLDPYTTSSPRHFLPCQKFETMAETLRHLDFGFTATTPQSHPFSDPITPPNTPFPPYPVPSTPISQLDFAFYGSQWDHRFVSRDLLLVLSVCRNLRSLRLSGCQFPRPSTHEWEAVVQALRGCTGLEVLDVSRSSLKGRGLVEVVEACGGGLRVLDVSGLFRFRRNNSSVLHKLIDACPNLLRLIANQCPDIDQEMFLAVSLAAPTTRALKVIRDRMVSRNLLGGGGGGGLPFALSLNSSTTASSLSSSSSSVAVSAFSSPLAMPAVMVWLEEDGLVDRVATIDEE
ncbi:hypothetical protein HDU98_003608 [Podochytrium sp. JEL0797]|nr:hypothetical protein HDU98_003608 [Podochytrium sp. JEL0797]